MIRAKQRTGRVRMRTAAHIVFWLTYWLGVLAMTTLVTVIGTLVLKMPSLVLVFAASAIGIALGLVAVVEEDRPHE